MQIMGVYKCVGGGLVLSQGIFKSVFVGLGVVDIKNIEEENEMQAQDINNIKMVS